MSEQVFYINELCHRYSAVAQARMLTNLYDAYMLPVGVTANQFGFLIDLVNYKDYGITELSDVMCLDRTTVSRNLAPLLKRELVEIAISKENNGKPGRKKIVIVTKKGLDVIENGMPLWHNAQDEARNLV